jgi:alpha-tubulin suppressor-like RCC1 family protein
MKVRFLLAAILMVACADASVAPDPGQVAFSTLSAGTDHSCGTVAAGGLYCWGSTAGGLLGLHSDTTAEPVPRRVLTGPIRSITVAAGDGMSCVLTTDQRALCWGSGDASPQPSAGADDLVAIAVGEFACGLTASGTARCWSAPGSAATEVAAPGPFTRLAVGGIGCGLLTDSTVACWDGGVTTATLVSGAVRMHSLAAGTAHACGVTDTDAVLCWGANESGQLGDHSRNAHAEAQPADLADGSVSVAAAGNYTCALTSVGDAWCWGGIPWLTQSFTFPVRAGVGFHLTALSLGTTHACAVDVVGATSYCWGQNEWGQLGDGSTTFSSSPVIVDGTR